MVREKVKEGAAWYVYHIQELIDELEPKAKLELVGEATVKSTHCGHDAGRRVVLGNPPTLAAN